MRRVVAGLLVLALVVALLAPAAHAGSTASKVALGLASFAVFNQLVAPLIHPRPAFAYTTVYPAPVVYAPSPVVVVPPAWPTVVQYPHGRYELRANGSTYTWVWIPAPPPPPGPQPPAAAPPSPGSPPPAAPAPCTPTGRYVKTPQGTLPECE